MPAYEYQSDFLVPDKDLQEGPAGTVAAPFARREKMGAEVATYLRDLIFSGSLRPGQRLPLADVAERLGVSTTPVREALLTLEKDGLMESERHRGFRVSRFSQQDIRDVYELHAFVASTLVQRATPHLPEATLAELADLDQQIREAVAKQQADAVENLNYRFHRRINEAAPDSTQLRGYLRETTRFVPRRVYQRVPGWLEASVQDHGPILAALRGRDDRAAAECSAQHIRRAGDLLVQHLDSIGIWSKKGTVASRA